MKNLKPYEQTAVLKLVHQLIISADGSINYKRDESEICRALLALGFEQMIAIDYVGIELWNKAIKFNPFEAYTIVSQLDENAKQEFKKLLDTIAILKGNIVNRLEIASQIYDRVGID